jgi:hypothetical protein
MPIDFIPSVPVAFSLGACAALPIVLLGMSHGPWKILAPGRRFVTAAVLIWATWLAAMAIGGPSWVDVVTGALLLATATVAGFTLWTLIAWGFTLSMLLTLERAQGPLTIEAWAREYTRGRSLEALARDRLGLLLRLGLAEIKDDKFLVPIRRGRWLGRIAYGCRRMFGLSR